MKRYYFLYIMIFLILGCTSGNTDDENQAVEESEQFEEGPEENQTGEETEVTIETVTCNLPNEYVVHPEDSTEQLVHDILFFPVGMSDQGVFAYFRFIGEMDPCPCVHADLHFYSLDEDTIIHSIPFRFDAEENEDDLDFFNNPENVWNQELEKYCTALKEQNIIENEFATFVGEELMTIKQLSTIPTTEDDLSPWPIKGYEIYNDSGELDARVESKEEIISAELAAMIRYQVGENYFFLGVVATTHPGFEGTLIRQFDIVGF